MVKIKLKRKVLTLSDDGRWVVLTSKRGGRVCVAQVNFVVFIVGGEVNHAKLTPVDSIGYSAAIIIESHEYNSI